MMPENRQRGRGRHERIVGRTRLEAGGMRSGRYHGWWVVFCTFVIALYGWGFGFYGLGLYLVALHTDHGWSPATISAGITFYYVAGAFVVMQVGDAIQRVGARTIVLAGVALMALGVVALTFLHQPWQLYLA